MVEVTVSAWGEEDSDASVRQDEKLTVFFRQYRAESVFFFFPCFVVRRVWAEHTQVFSLCSYVY